MSRPTCDYPAKRSRWLDWRLSAQIAADSAEGEPTEQPKSSSVGFDGSNSGESPVMRAETGATEREPALKAGSATALLNRAGVRIMRLKGVFTIGIRSDLDGPEIRGALCTLEMDRLPVRFLDGGGVPIRYELRRVRETRHEATRFYDERGKEDKWR